MIRGALFFILLGVAGCSFGISTSLEAKKYFILNELQSEDCQAGVQIDRTLRVRKTEAGRFVDSQRIIFSSDSRERGYYQFAFWVDTPPRRVSYLLETALSRSGLFSSVVRESSGIAADYELVTEIVDFYHDTSDQPGSAQVKVQVELVDLINRRVLARKLFSISEPASSYDVEGAIEGFQRAVNGLSLEIISWLETVLTPIEKP